MPLKKQTVELTVEIKINGMLEDNWYRPHFKGSVEKLAEKIDLIMQSKNLERFD